MALRIVARPGAWFALLTSASDSTRAAERLVEEIAMLGNEAPRRLDATAGSAALAQQARDAGPGILVAAAFEAFGDDEWRHLDLLRSQLVRDEQVVLVLSQPAFEGLMRNAPNVASLLGGAVWTLDAEAEILTDEEKEQRLAALRDRFALSDAEMIARVERGDLPLEPEHAEWLVLLDRGDLLERH
jgi:hypothetical protein